MIIEQPLNKTKVLSRQLGKKGSLFWFETEWPDSNTTPQKDLTLT